jgi:phosphoglycolate phosphatase
MEKKRITAVITDLDNTLYDWFGIWYRCFRPMLDEIVRISGADEERVIGEIRAVHQKYGTTEYAFLIQELPSIRQRHPAGDVCEIYESAIGAYRDNRRKYLELYPGVMDTLAAIRRAGSLIVGYTESKQFYTNYRIRKLDLDGVIDFVYSPPDHELPGSLRRTYPQETYDFKSTVQRFTPDDELKPNPKVLLEIIGDIGVPKDDVLYVGDSLFKDVLMAQNAGVLDVYAKYGEYHERREYELLRRVTHWTEEMVQRERSAGTGRIVPGIVLENGFAEILGLFDFASPARRDKPGENGTGTRADTSRTG